MGAVLAYSLVLLSAAFLSGIASRTVLSTSVLFLVAGVVLGPHVLGVFDPGTAPSRLQLVSELALFGILFSDGTRVAVRDLSWVFRLAGRALVVALPLTLVGIALTAHVVVGLGWGDALLVGAVLSPTDPVFAAALVGSEAVPARLRALLNVESGLNDGLALPLVLILMAAVGLGETHPVALAAEVVGGVALGVVVPLAAAQLLRIRALSPHELYAAMYVVAIGGILWSVSSLTHANEFLAAFVGGAAVASSSREHEEAFREFGEIVAQLLSLGALLLFGSVLSPRLAHPTWEAVVFVALALLAARPLSLAVALLGSSLPRDERLAAAWFGPKGFASVVYTLWIFKAGGGQEIVDLLALTIVTSMVLHSSSDVLVSRWLVRHEEERAAADQA